MKSGFLAVGVAVAGLLSVHARELKIEKLGTTCVGGVEANPLVYRGRLYHFESFRDSSKGRVWGPNCCGRFRDLEGDLNEPLAPAPKGLYFACAFVEGEKVVVTGVKSPGANHVLQCESTDLRNWETSPRVVLDFDENDRRLYPGIAFTDEEKERIRTSEDINASDFDMCEWKGDLVISYSWGNQRGKEFLALAKVRNATEREFCESFFDGPVSLRAGVSLPADASRERIRRTLAFPAATCGASEAAFEDGRQLRPVEIGKEKEE